MRPSRLFTFSILFALASCGGAEESAPAGAGCARIEQFSSEGTGHIADGTRQEYRTDPPTSGPHYSSPAPTGVHSDPAPRREQLVHNLEHGHVIIYVVPGRLANAPFESLASVVLKDEPRRTLFVPLLQPPPETNVAFVSWQHMQKCAGTGPELASAAKIFVERFAGKGPEGDIPGQPLQ